MKAYTSFFLMQLDVKEKYLQHIFRKMGNGQKANSSFFDAKSLGLFKCNSLLIKYHMCNKKCHFESSWIVRLKDTAATLMSGTMYDREEVKNSIVASPVWLLSAEFTITLPFVLRSHKTQ